MRFNGPLMLSIREDRKTVTRRIVVPGKPCAYKVGRVYVATSVRVLVPISGGG